MKPTQPPEGRTPLEIVDALEGCLNRTIDLLTTKRPNDAEEVAFTAARCARALRTALERQESERVEQAVDWLEAFAYDVLADGSYDVRNGHADALRLLRALEGGQP